MNPSNLNGVKLRAQIRRTAHERFGEDGWRLATVTFLLDSGDAEIIQVLNLRTSGAADEAPDADEIPVSENNRPGAHA